MASTAGYGPLVVSSNREFPRVKNLEKIFLDPQKLEPRAGSTSAPYILSVPGGGADDRFSLSPKAQQTETLTSALALYYTVG